MAFTDYLAQLQQPRQMQTQIPDTGTQQVNMLMEALQRKQQFELQDAERKRLAAERDRKAKEDRLKASDEMVGRLAQSGMGKAAADAYKQGQGLRQELYGFAGPDIVGSPQHTVYDRVTKQPLPEYDVPTYGPQTLDMLTKLSGQKPETKAANPGQYFFNERTGQVIFHAPALNRVAPAGKYGNYSYNPEAVGGGASLPAGVPPAASAPAARPAMVVPPAPAAARSGGGRRSGGRAQRDRLQRITLSNGNVGILNLDTQQVTDTGSPVYQKPASSSGGSGAMTDAQLEKRAIDNVKALPSYKDMDDDEYEAALTKARQKIQAQQPRLQQPQKLRTKSAAPKKGLASSLLKRLEAL